VKVALDDFGTGYSSLSTLRRHPVDILKLDRSFVGGLDEEPAAGPVLHAAVEMGRALGLRVVAEGIETPRQLEQLRGYGCRLGQGYLFSKPVTAEQAAALLSIPPRAAVEAA
jgi:EAL domain-containing protein (putative c-di-GMP-specific phosphodiesterase class I)